MNYHFIKDKSKEDFETALKKFKDAISDFEKQK